MKVGRIIAGVAFLLVGAVMFFVTKRVQVEAGHEAVLVDKPFWTIFGEGGVRSEPLTTGSKWLFYTTELIAYDVRPHQHTEAFDDVKDGTITSDNIPIDFNAYIKVRPIPGNTPRLHSLFGPSWYALNLKEVFRTAVRDEVADSPMTALTARQLNADGKDILGEIQRKVLAKMRAFVKDKGIDAEVMEVIVGKATPPQKILDSLADTAAQQQRAKTEDERTKAEIQRKAAETERANADNAYRNSIGFTPAQFLQLEMGKLHVQAVEKCSGKANCTALIGTLGGIQPAITIK
jgi:regulator of protease activity HflC (stomatin/prohibitin superfamily)